jgi:thiaminase (transcriptional activator TenA)
MAAKYPDAMISAVTRNPDSWTARLWNDAAAIHTAILEHPFLTGLTSGELDPKAFGHYVIQDALYLRDYARTLAIVGAKAPTHADTGMFARHAAGTVDVELALHETLLGDLGLDPAAIDVRPVAPTTRAYTSYLLATAYGGSFADGLAAVLPCYWIYAEVGAALVTRGSPDVRYQRWIDTYAGEEFTGVVAEVLALADRIGPKLSVEAEARARGHFVTTARYEWMFWDAAWRREAWPL